MGDQAGDARELLTAHAPDVQVGHARAVLAVRELRQHFAYFFDHRVIHLAIEQHRPALAHQADGPAAYQHRADQTHHRVQPAPSQPPATRQCNDRQYRGGGIGHHVQIRRTQVDVVMAVAVIAVTMSMIVVIMPVRLMAVVVPVPVIMAVVCAAEDQRTGQVDDQADHGDRHRLLIVNRLGGEQPLDRAKHHQASDAKQEDGAGECGENFDLPGPERESAVLRQSAGRRIGERGQADGQRVRAHVPAIGQQCHRIEDETRGDFDDHHRQRDPHD